MHHSLNAAAFRRATIAVLIAGFLGGCATAAQRQYQAMATGNAAISGQARNCVSEVYNSPDAAVIRSHTPLDPREATLAQLSDQSLPTRQEIAVVLTLHQRIQSCRKAILNGLQNTTPSVIPILAKEYAGADDDTIAFVQRKMSWGERVKRARDRVLSLQEALQAEGRRIVAGLEGSHEAELARRQAAANALAQWAQTQQVINAMNRPVMTNCMNIGSGMVNCTSMMESFFYKAPPTRPKFNPVWRASMPVLWKGRTGVFRRDIGDSEHAEVMVEGRIYRVRTSELS